MISSFVIDRINARFVWFKYLSRSFTSVKYFVYFNIHEAPFGAITEGEERNDQNLSSRPFLKVISQFSTFSSSAEAASVKSVPSWNLACVNVATFAGVQYETVCGTSSIFASFATVCACASVAVTVLAEILLAVIVVTSFCGVLSNTLIESPMNNPSDVATDITVPVQVAAFERSEDFWKIPCAFIFTPRFRIQSEP